MTRDDFSGLNESACKAMDALFEFSEAMSGRVSIADLAAVMRVAIKEGHGMLAIQLAMAQNALSTCNSEDS